MAAKAQKPTATNEDKVEITVPRGPANDDPNLFISVNGVNYLLPRGKTSRVPLAVAQEYARSVAAQDALDRRMQAMIDASQEAGRRL